MIMTVTIKQIIDAPLVDSLEYICEEHNLNIDDVRQMNRNKKIEITVDDALFIGLVGL